MPCSPANSIKVAEIHVIDSNYRDNDQCLDIIIQAGSLMACNYQDVNCAS